MLDIPAILSALGRINVLFGALVLIVGMITGATKGWTATQIPESYIGRMVDAIGGALFGAIVVVAGMLAVFLVRLCIWAVFMVW